QPSSDWSAVRGLAKGTFVVVALNEKNLRPGLIWDVSDTTLTIRGLEGTSTIPRGDVARVSVRDQIGTKRAPWYVGIPVASAILGGLAGMIVGAIAKDHDVVSTSAWTFGIGMSVGVGSGPMGHPQTV